MNTALLLVDIQNDYFPGGRMVLDGSEDAGQKAARLLAFCRGENLLAVHIRHISLRPGAAFFLPGTVGSEIHEVVKPSENEKVFLKHYPNSFRETGLLTFLQEKGIGRLVICGMMTHMCIDTTVRAAFDLGFECLVAGDACATRSLALKGLEIPAGMVHRAFLAGLDGIFGKVLDAEEILRILE